MIPQLRRWMFMNIYIENMLVLLICIYMIFLIIRFLIFKKDMFPIKKYPSKEITIFKRKTTVINIVFLPIFISFLLLYSYAKYTVLDDYKKYFNNEYYEGEFVVIKTSNSGGRYRDRHVTLESLKDDKIIQFRIIEDKYKPGECYYVQYYDEVQYGAFGKKIDCVTKETLESYCDLDVCK